MLGFLENILSVIIFIQLMAWLSHKHFFDAYFQPICFMFIVVYILRKILKD
jgi:hypothetical protein